MNGTSQNTEFKRKHHQGFWFNDKEIQALNKYCKKYKIKNKSKFFRESIVATILNKFDEDYPTLFPNDEKKEV